jgi:ribosomal protein L35AE/L33A
MTYDEISQFVASMTNMTEYNHMVACLKVKYKQLQSIQKAQFTLGGKVQFTDKLGNTHYGTVLKKNPKTIIVQTATGKWQVGPSLLKIAA